MYVFISRNPRALDRCWRFDTALTNKFQLIDGYDQGQNNILEMHSLMPHYSYTKKFDVITCIIDLVEYKMCYLHSSESSKRLTNRYTKYKTLQWQHFQQTNKN